MRSSNIIWRSFLLAFLMSCDVPRCTLILTMACIDNSPSNVTTVLGDIAEFQCSASCGIVAWLVNETSVFSLQQNHNLSYLSGPRSDGVHGETSTLQIVAEDTANNTMIRCIVIDPDYNTIINSSTSVYLRVQGKPLPPADLSVHISNQCEIELNWKSPFILSSDDHESTRIEMFLTPMYIVYGFLITNGLDMDLFYRRKTNSSAANLTLDFEMISVVISGNNFSLIAFSVSTKLSLVGEGSMSDRKVLTKEDIQAFCKQGLPSTEKEPDDDRVTGSNHEIIIYICAVLVSMMLVTLLCILCTLYLQRHNQCKDTMKRSSLNNEEISLRSNCAYESGDQISKKVLDLKAASVTQMTTEIIIKPNDSYEPHKAWIGN